MPKKEYIILPLLFIFSFSYLIIFCRYGFNIADEGVPLSGALRIMRGEVPLKDFQGYMPGIYYFYYSILKIFGMDILTVRYVISFFTAIMIVMYYMASRKIMSPPFSVFCAFTILTVPGEYFVRFLSFFIISNIITFYGYINAKPRASFYMGIVGGITFLFRQDLGLSIFCLAMVVFFVKRYIANNTDTISEIKKYLLGYFLIVVPLITYYLYEGNLSYILNANYNAFFGGYQRLSLPFPKFSSSWHEIGLFYMPVAIYLFAFVHIIKHIRDDSKREIYKLYILLIGVFSFNQAIWRTEPGNIVKIITPAVILYFYFCNIIYSRLKPKLVLKWIAIIIFSLIPISYAYAMNKNYGSYIGGVDFSLSRYKLMDIQRAKIYASPRVLSEYTEIVSYIKDNTGPNDKIFVIPFIGLPLYFLSDRINPAYFEWILPPEPDIYPDVEERVIDSLIKDKTKLIIYVDYIFDGLENRRFKNYAPKLYKWIIENYYLAEMIGDYQILKLGDRYSHNNIFFDTLDYAVRESFHSEYIKKTGMNMNGDKRVTLFEHPPAVIKYKMKIPANSLLNFGIAIAPQVWDTGIGDGVNFEIVITEGEKDSVLFSRYINPKANKNERKWIDESIDMSDYGGKEVLLTLKTSEGPRGDNSYDWAGWSKLEFVTKNYHVE